MSLIGWSTMRYKPLVVRMLLLVTPAGSYLIGTSTTIVGSQAGRFTSGSRNTFVGMSN